MGISLAKGGTVSLSKEDPSLDEVEVGLGWNPRITDGAKFDLDASAFLLTDTGKVRAAGNGLTNDISDFCCYLPGSLKIANGAVQHMGDNQDGVGEGDDETIKIFLSQLPDYVKKVAVVITIYKARERGQNFGQVDGAYARIVNAKTGNEIVRYDLSEDASTETAVIIGEIYRHNEEWKFRAVGQGFQGGLYKICHMYGINADDDG